MVYIVLVGISSMLLGGFLLLTGFERGRGLRVAGSFRNALDAKVARAAFIAKHVDWGAFVKHLSGTVLERVAHDIAHTVLLLVRTIERTLTRAVRSLRERRGLANEGPGTEDTAPIEALIAKARVALRNARRASRKPVRAAENATTDA